MIVLQENYGRRKNERITKISNLREGEYCHECFVSRKIQLRKKFKKAVWKRANSTCEMCGETDERCLTVHHEDKENYPYDPDKARLLCYNCHWGKIHGLDRDD